MKLSGFEIIFNYLNSVIFLFFPLSLSLPLSCIPIANRATYHPARKNTKIHLHPVISYTAAPYAVKGSVAANRVAADGRRLMMAKDGFQQLPQMSKQKKEGLGGGGGKQREG